MKLCLVNADLREVDAKDMATVIAGLERIYMFFSGVLITTEQTIAIFTAISRSTNLKEIAFEEIDLSSVDPDVLATAVSKVENVGLNLADLTTAQISSILTRVQEKSNLKRLNLELNRTTDVNTNLVRRARETLGDELKLDNPYEWDEIDSESENEESEEDEIDSDSEDGN